MGNNISSFLSGIKMTKVKKRSKLQNYQFILKLIIYTQCFIKINTVNTATVGRKDCY